jgi:hypothetical protein
VHRLAQVRGLVDVPERCERDGGRVGELPWRRRRVRRQRARSLLEEHEQDVSTRHDLGHDIVQRQAQAQARRLGAPLVLRRADQRRKHVPSVTNTAKQDCDVLHRRRVAARRRPRLRLGRLGRAGGLQAELRGVVVRLVVVQVIGGACGLRHRPWLALGGERASLVRELTLHGQRTACMLAMAGS